MELSAAIPEHSPMHKTSLGSTGEAVIMASTPRGGFNATATMDSTLSSILLQSVGCRGRVAADEIPEDLHEQRLALVEAQFFSSPAEKERINVARKKYPQRRQQVKLAGGEGGEALEGENEDQVQRRIMGFGLGFEKIFATTSINLPVSAYTIFVELHAAHMTQVSSRCFNGLHTVFDLKKWIFETLLVPMNAYELSYAEPGKAHLTDQLRLLTTQESLDTRTLATARAVHKTFKGVPGVHSIADPGVTRLYVRLKCRTCGDLLNSLQTCRKFKSFGHIEPAPDKTWVFSDGTGNFTLDDDDGPTVPNKIKGVSSKAKSVATGRPSNTGWREKYNKDARTSVQHTSDDEGGCTGTNAMVPGSDPNIEDCWYPPDPRKHCLFHTRGYEMFEGARTHSGGHAELARVYIARGKEPSKKLATGQNVLKKRGPAAQISYA
jgi:hypothetical protein